MSSKWDNETTIKFIQCYKVHPCLWNFQSPDYKNKQKRDAAYLSISEEMNVSGFGVPEVKNKIKNLRSTYSQELKKVKDSKKSGAGVDSIYVSNIKWLKEMEEIFAQDLKRNTFENVNETKKRETNAEETDSTISLQSPTGHDAINIKSNTSTVNSTVVATTSHSGNPSRAKKRSRDIIKAISDLKSIQEEANSEEDSQFEIFGKNVAMQLKNMSVENALLAQSRIQNILTEFGIKDYRERTRWNYKSPRPSSEFSNATSDCTSDDTAEHKPPNWDPLISSPPMESNDIISFAISAAFDCQQDKEILK